MAGITGAPPAGPDWRTGRYPSVTRYLLGGMLTAIVAVLLFILFV